MYVHAFTLTQYYFNIANNKDSDYTTLRYDSSEQTAVAKQYTYKNNAYTVKTKKADISSFKGNVKITASSSGIDWNKKKELDMLDHYFYRTGSNGKKKYLKVGNMYTSHTIRTDNLSSSKNAKCESYKTAIKDGIDSYKTALTYFGSSSLLSAVLLVVAVCFTNPVTLIIALVTSIFGSGGGIVEGTKALIKACRYQSDAEDYYNDIKSY